MAGRTTRTALPTPSPSTGGLTVRRALRRPHHRKQGGAARHATEAQIAPRSPPASEASPARGGHLLGRSPTSTGRLRMTGKNGETRPRVHEIRGVTADRGFEDVGTPPDGPARHPCLGRPRRADGPTPRLACSSSAPSAGHGRTTRRTTIAVHRAGARLETLSLGSPSVSRHGREHRSGGPGCRVPA